MSEKQLLHSSILFDNFLWKESTKIIFVASWCWGQEIFFPLRAKQRLLWRQTAFIAWPHLIRACLPDLAPRDLTAHSCALSNPRCAAFYHTLALKPSSLPSLGRRFWRHITSSTAKSVCKTHTLGYILDFWHLFSPFNKRRSWPWPNIAILYWVLFYVVY